MGEVIWKLLAAVAGSTILSTIITDQLAKRRERHAVRRSRVEEMTKLYEEMLSLLDIGRRRRCRGDDALLERIVGLNSRMELRATPEVREQFQKAGWALEKWATLAKRAEPAPFGDGMILIRSGMGEEQAEADALYPAVHEETDKL